MAGAGEDVQAEANRIGCRIFKELDERIDIDDADIEVVSIALARAVGDGFRLGQAETAAQLIESGIRVRVEGEITDAEYPSEDDA